MHSDSVKTGLCPTAVRHKNKSHISPIVINLVKGHRLFLVVRCPGNHEFPDHEKNGINLDFLLLMSFTFIHEFPFFKIKQ